MIKDYNVLDKYNKIWNKIKEKLSTKFRSMPVYDEICIKAKVREFDVRLRQTFQVMKYQEKICTMLAFLA